MLAEPASKIPAKCSCCNCELSSASVEMQMTPEQLDIYLFYMSKSIAKETDQVARCPFCSYFEFWGKNATSNFFFCKKEGWKKGSCSICHREFKVPSNGFNITEEEFEEIKSDTGMMSHTKCYQYKQIKDDWEKALEEGIKRKCPSWGVGGIKNDACTHMRCNNCQTQWCYVWAKALEDLNYDPSRSPMYGHNVNWNTNPRRCPMYLTEIHQIDDRYTQDDQEWKMLFHKLLTYKNIKKFFDEYHQLQFDELCQVFPSVLNHGYDIEEALTTDLTIIRR